MKGIEIEFKNLNIGYYFIFDGKLYEKNSDHSAILLYSKINDPLFTNVSTKFFNTDENLTYIRPSNTKVVFEPKDIIEFITRDSIKSYISSIMYNDKKFSKFKDIEIGSFFFNRKDSKIYIKKSYNKAFKIFKNEVGLNNNSKIEILSISSAFNTTPSNNRMYYNNDLLIQYKISPLNVVWFDENINNFNYSNFDIDYNFESEINRLFEFVKNIPNDCLVFIFNTKDSKYFYSENSYHDISELIKKNNYQNTFSTIGLDTNIIANLNKSDSFLIVSEKNNKILEFKLSNPKDNYNNIISYKYSYNNSNTDIIKNCDQIMNLDSDVYKLSILELNLFLINEKSHKNDNKFSLVDGNSNI